MYTQIKKMNIINYTRQVLTVANFMEPTAKIHKLSYNDNTDQLPLRPVVSSIGTASYHLSKYLAILLSLLSQSEYIVINSKEFSQKFNNVVPLNNNSKLVSFDVPS